MHETGWHAAAIAKETTQTDYGTNAEEGVPEVPR